MRPSLLASVLSLSIVLVLRSVACAQPAEVSGIQVPEGFRVTQVATDAIATNIYSMAVSPEGQTFVTGPGYIKILLDSDGDRVFDSTKTYSNLPRSGAQGICFDGDDLICSGDGALLKFTDANKDGIADGPPTKIFSIKTGGEHDAHSVRKGPDGWWYVLAGNSTTISDEFFADPYSPVKNPRAGFLLRISPDWTRKQIYCHGFRNAYDFDFNSIGEVFVFDSDGERDASLPWYRPTRVFRMRPGDDAGFVDRSWKRPSYFFDMPLEVGSLGRGSPTGVIVGQSKSFPAAFDDAIFVADWTFGRVVAFQRDRNGKYDRGSEFAVANGQFGFAVTDLDFEKDGSLLVSVGGRGTQGGVYRVSYVGAGEEEQATEDSVTWTKTKRFISKAKAQGATKAEVVAALNSSDARRRECALEALLVGPLNWRVLDPRPNNREIVDALVGAAKQLTARESVLLARILPSISSGYQQEILGQLTEFRAGIANGLTRHSVNDGKLDSETLELALSMLPSGGQDVGALARLGQIALGGCGANGEQAMFVGYSSRHQIELRESDRQRYSDLLAEALANTSDQTSREEIGRLAAMLGVGSEKLQSLMAQQLTTQASVPQDIHWLNCISQILGQSDNDKTHIPAELESKLANALIGIGGKLERDDLNIDRNFYPRLKTLVGSLFENSGLSFAERVVEQMTGAESEVFLFQSLPQSAKEARQTALGKFAQAIENSAASATSAQLKVLANDSSGKYLPLIRSLANRSEFRGLAIKAISNAPVADDRELLLAGLESAELGTLKHAAIGLRRIFDESRPKELAASIAAARRLGWDKSSVSVRDQLMMLAAKHDPNSAEEIGYQSKKEEMNQSGLLDLWEEVVSTEYPEQYKQAFKSSGPVDWNKARTRIGAIAWDTGDAVRGSGLYKSLQCAACHDGGSRLGPKLEGLSKRFSREDIFKSILMPDQQVPQRYRALVIETLDGKLYRGSQVYDSVDGITLQQVDGTTVRINKQDIEDRTLSAKSLMPAGLLKDSSDQDWADLYKYLITK